MKNILSKSAAYVSGWIDVLALMWINWHTERQYRNNPDFEEVKLLRSEIKPGDWRFDMQHSAIGPMCEAFAEFLDSANAKNHVQFDLFPKLSSARQWGWARD